VAQSKCRIQSRPSPAGRPFKQRHCADTSTQCAFALLADLTVAVRFRWDSRSGLAAGRRPPSRLAHSPQRRRCRRLPCRCHDLAPHYNRSHLRCCCRRSLHRRLYCRARPPLPVPPRALPAPHRCRHHPQALPPQAATCYQPPCRRPAVGACLYTSPALPGRYHRRPP
jgi:hypothetical protein